MKYIIYKAVNKVNNKVYIGLTTNTLRKRIRGHVSDSCKNKTIFGRAIRKYGIDNFEFSIIFVLLKNDLKTLQQYEYLFIKEYNSSIIRKDGYGYNMTNGGQFGDSETASYYNKKRVKEGKHIFQTKKFIELKKEVSEKLIKEGKHNFQSEDNKKKTSLRNLENFKKGIDPFAGKDGTGTNESRLKNGTHNFIIERTCPHCSLTGRGPNMLRYHFDNCKKIKNP